MKDYPKLVRELLEDHYWIQTIEPMFSYRRVHDDTDGDRSQMLEVVFDKFGDGYIMTHHPQNYMLRFRTHGGGGRSERTRAALMILAEAIRLDEAQDRAEHNGDI